MTQTQSCVYCGAPLSPDAFACDACGQPVPTVRVSSGEPQPPAPEVPESYIAQPGRAEPLPPAQGAPSPPPAHEAESFSPPPDTPPQGDNTCLRITLIVAIMLLLLCCCAVVIAVVVMGNVDWDSLSVLLRSTLAVSAGA